VRTYIEGVYRFSFSHSDWGSKEMGRNHDFTVKLHAIGGIEDGSISGCPPSVADNFSLWKLNVHFGFPPASQDPSLTKYQVITNLRGLVYKVPYECSTPGVIDYSVVCDQ
jgi:hypothetical protein